MGKRKNKDANYLKKKIRKLEDKLKNLSQDSEDESPCRPSSRQYTPPPPPSATETMVMEESTSINANETEANNYTGPSYIYFWNKYILN